MINVSHERDDRRPEFKLLRRLILFRLGLLNNLLHLVDTAPLLPLLSFKDESVLLTDFFCNLGLNCLIGRHENLQGNEILHDLKRLQPHHLRQHTDNDGRLDADGISLNNSSIVRDFHLFPSTIRIDRGHKIAILFLHELRYARELLFPRFLCFPYRCLFLLILVKDVQRFILPVLNGLLLRRLSPLPLTARRFLGSIDQVEHLLLFVAIAVVWHDGPVNLTGRLL